MKKPIQLTSILLFMLIISCHEPTSTSITSSIGLKTGAWRMVLNLPDAKLPFNFNLSKIGSEYSISIFNDIEKIEVSDVSLKEDSIFINMPVFQSKFMGRIESDSNISGVWNNLSKGKDYLIKFTAEQGDKHRFSSFTGDFNKNISGNYEVTFSPENEEDMCKAIGVFNQADSNKISGTFITETGDYRFLEGDIKNDSLFLSCFDGSHAFLFKAKIEENGTLSGSFWSGKHWKENWVGVRNESFQLTNPDSLTFLKEGYDELVFSFPNLDSQMVSLKDEKYMNKIVIVQIAGSWCPNCADETVFLTDIYDKYHEEGLEIITLAFEKSDRFEDNVNAVAKFKKDLNAEYEFLLAGPAGKKEAQKSLPMLNHIMSYPTCIFIDGDKKIRKIRTGFYGPGTGDIYVKHTKEITDFIESLLHDRPI